MATALIFFFLIRFSAFFKQANLKQSLILQIYPQTAQLKPWSNKQLQQTDITGAEGWIQHREENCFKIAFSVSSYVLLHFTLCVL